MSESLATPASDPDVMMSEAPVEQGMEEEEVERGDSAPPPKGQNELIGRTVRLHFRCRAELPIGSFLRVTGSSLWAPGTPSSDPADAAFSVERTEASAFPTTLDELEGDHHSQSLYASSVEMVTTPEEYPIWRTRKPVVVVIPNRRKSVHHHYYRYLVVSPGGQLGQDEGIDDDDVDAQVVVSTSDEKLGSTAVLQWEDPFGSRVDPNKHENSVLSLASVAQPQNTKSDYRNLPYRTIDVGVSANSSVFTTSRPATTDHYSNPDDASFQPYLIREAINQENRRKQLKPQVSLASQISDAMATDGAENADGEPGVGVGAMLTGTDTEYAKVKPMAAQSKASATPPPAFRGQRIFFVCFHLPVVVVQHPTTKRWRASWSESILAKTEGSQILSQYQAYWVGTVTTNPPLENKEDTEEVRSILGEMKCIPIFLDTETREAHYYGFCKQVLWPAFHNIDLLDLSTCGWLPDQDGASDWDQSRLDDWWNAFRRVNKEFCRVMSELSDQDDILWIHDYHLALLPEQLTKFELETFGRRMTRKVFFLHIPFPTSQIFRELECGESILQGMLHADVVGFHAFDHARHFLNAAKRILGLNYENLVGGLIGVNFQGQTVLVSMSNVSIEPRMVDAALMLPSVQTGAEELKNKHKGRTIIGALDIAQRLSGTSLKLLAYERMLQDYPLWKSKVVMVQRLLRSGSRVKDEEVTTREVRFLVQRIQEKFGPEVIDYEEMAGNSMVMDQRLALWKATDILMNTPIREGLNHWPMEYIYTHKEPNAPGVVIASEFSAICSILNGALRVNPYDIKMMITTIDKALSMDMQEREGRRYRDIDFVSNSPSDKWVKNVLRDLRDATIHQNNNSNASESNSQTPTPGGMTPIRKELIDSVAAFLARESSLAFANLNIRAMKRAYDSSQRRVIITDFNGTIVMKEPPGKYLKREILGTSGNKPPEAVIDALSSLCSDPRNTVYVVSGDSSENVLNALGDLPGLGLAVSNGARFSPPVVPGENHRRWYTFDLGVDWDAVKRVALPVLSKYTARSNGSFVKLTSFSIGWSYYSCDPEWGSLQASHLVLELENELRAFDVRFVTLKGIVEVVPRQLNKGLIVKKVLRDTSMKHHPGVDFVLCLGDDISDEKMFASVFSFMAEMGDEENSHPGPPVMADGGFEEEEDDYMEDSTPTKTPDQVYCFTVAVGKKQTHASFYVNGAQDVANALVMLAHGDVPRGGVPVWGRENATYLFE
ncbi:hypothetical protein ACA910_003890 [Epithemia clementina (nom. ined.)]